MIKFYKCTETAIYPKRSSEGAAGFDLYADCERIVHARCAAIVETGITTEFADSVVGMIWPRSGLAAKFGIDTLAGVIDSDYRGEINVVLVNLSDNDYHISAGDRIAQIVFQLVLTCAENAIGCISETERGSSGFGGTGK